jgi:predicted DNA-binding protein YlxM (UPF0122 family)
MKKTILTLACFSFLFFSMTSCGGSSEPKEMDTQIEAPVAEEPVAEENDFSSLTTAEDAMNEYKSMLEDYADKVKNGEVDAAKELKTKLDELKTYAEGQFDMKEIKALSDLTKLAVQLESGKNVDLNKAFNAYEKSLEMLKDMPMDDETKDALKQSQDAMDKLKGLGGL